MQEDQEDRDAVYPTTIGLDVKRNYRCAGCYGHLQGEFLPDDMIRLYCPECGPGRGIVTAWWVERRRSESVAELWEAKENLRDIIPQQEERLTPEEIIEQLGF